MMSWPADPESLLAGPRGRRLCWALAAKMGGSGQARGGLAWQQVPSYLLGANPADLASELAAAVDRTDWASVVADMSDLDLLEPLAESVTSATYWQGPDPEDRALAHPQVADALRPVARAITAAPATRWWSGHLDPGTQQYVESVLGLDEGPPLSGAASRLAAWLAATGDEESSAAERPADPAAPYSGHWWSSPTWAGLADTTRALHGLGPLQLFAMEDWPGWAEVRCWPVTPDRPARICEITGPDDWVALVTRYPLEVTKSRRHDWWRVAGWAGPWLMPDYAAAAADYEAVHLTVGGYLTTSGRALAVNNARCLLAGWDPDKTYWLADALAGVGPPVRWIRDDSVHLGWRQADLSL
jgi:hypothetical protein